MSCHQAAVKHAELHIWYGSIDFFQSRKKVVLMDIGILCDFEERSYMTYLLILFMNERASKHLYMKIVYTLIARFYTLLCISILSLFPFPFSPVMFAFPFFILSPIFSSFLRHVPGPRACLRFSLRYIFSPWTLPDCPAYYAHPHNLFFMYIVRFFVLSFLSIHNKLILFHYPVTLYFPFKIEMIFFPFSLVVFSFFPFLELLCPGWNPKNQRESTKVASF